MSFPTAIQAVMDGKKITRLDWGDNEAYGVLQDQYLMIYRDGKYYQWIVTEMDMFAVDWITLSV